MISRPPNEQDLTLAALVLRAWNEDGRPVPATAEQAAGVMIVAEFLSMLAPQMEMLTAMMPPMES